MKPEGSQKRKPEVEQEHGDAEETLLRSLYVMKKERKKQAVVVIHGMGEQKPMDTVRGFVDAVLDEPGSDEKYYSKPNEMSESFELRKLQNRSSEHRTDFFEYYWAHKVKGTTMSHITEWARPLLLRLPWKIPRRARLYWVISWILILVLVGFVIKGASNEVGSADIGSGFSFAVAGILAVLFGGIQYFILYWVGDAVRYLSPSPRNIDLRQSIRADGIKLLRKIHEYGNYDRVIVVGHSLGSVIAYDILKHLWQDYYKCYFPKAKHKQPALKDVENKGRALVKSEFKALSLECQQVIVEDFQESQHKLWRELRDLGNPWLVTDLITAGSPLYLAALLLAESESDLDRRQKQRELPKCPPVPEVPEQKNGKEESSYSYEIWEPFSIGATPFKLRRIHHAGHLAFVRWTNLYFPTRWGLFGDFVCGPLRKWFGPGINDIAVTTSKCRGLAKCTILAHNCYWWPKDKGRQKKDGKPMALTALIKALNLKRSKPEEVVLCDSELCRE
jgi:hypothetical protein